MHRAHFIAVVYSRLALKQSGANSQAPFRLNSSVKNSWQYLNMMIFFYHYSYIIMDNKSLNQIRIEWVCEQFQYVCTTCTSYCFWRKHKTYSDTLNSIIRPFEKFKPTCSALVSCALALYVIVELRQSNMVF